MAGYWIKFYTEFNNDPKIGMLPRDAQLLFVKLLLVAAENDKEGNVPTTSEIAWMLREQIDWVETNIAHLVSIHIVDKNQDGTYKITNYKKRQSKFDDKERQREHRRKNNQVDMPLTDMSQTCHEPVTDVSQEINSRYVERKKEREDKKEREEREIIPQIVENDNSSPAPILANSFSQTGDAFYTRVWSTVTGMVAIPGGELPKVLAALDALRSLYPKESDLVDYLKKYYEDWKARKRKDGSPYSRVNCAWVYDLAVAGEPVKADVVNQPTAKPDPNCPICHGIGLVHKELDRSDPHFGKLSQCECVKVREK